MATEIPVNKDLQKFYDKAFDWMLSFGPRLLLSIIIFIAGAWLIGVIRRRVTRTMNRKKVHSALQPFIESLVFTSLYILLVLLIMQILGIRLTIFAAVIAAFGAAVGLALSGTLQNFASGVLILLLKPFTTGDNIIAQGFEGTVTSIQIFYTIVTTFDKRTVIMPNSKLSNEVIVNITRIGSRRLDIELKFHFTDSPDKIKEIVQKTIAESADVLKEPIPRIGISALTDSGYTLLVNVWLNAHGFEDAKLILNERLLKDLQDAGVWAAK